MPAAAQQLDGWPGIGIALLGARAVMLVPLTGFMREWWGYRKEVRVAEAMKPDVACDISAATGGAVFDSIALSDLAKAINCQTAEMVADTASEEAQHTSQMSAAITRFTEVTDRWEDDYGRQPRRR